MDVVVLGMHGVVYSYASKHDVTESLEIFQEIVEDYIQKCPEFRFALQNKELYLNLEEQIVYDITNENYDMGIFEMPNAIKNLLNYVERGAKVVIISTSKVSTTKMILKYLFKQHNVKNYKEIINSFDIYSLSEYGHKSNFISWVKIFENYDSIDRVFEDRKLYLGVAKKAAHDLHFKPEFYTKICY